jgi:hypothetical protein
MTRRTQPWLLIGVLMAPLLGFAYTRGEADAFLVGSWSERSSLTPDGRGVLNSLHITRDASHWYIAFTRTTYKGGSAAPESATTGPLEAVVDRSTVRIKEDGREYTYRIEGDRLLLPAVVPLDDRTWVIRSPDIRPEEGTFRCEHNPSEVPVGKASFPSVKWEGLQQFYVLEEVPSSVPGEARKSTHLRFLNRTPDGRLIAQEMLVWNPGLGPMLQGSGSLRMQQRIYYRDAGGK